MVKEPERVPAYLALLLTVAIWGIATVVIKATVATVPPLTFLMLRFWMAAIITVPAAVLIFRHTKIGFVRLKHIFNASLLGYVLALALIFTGLELTTAVEGALITSFSPLLVTALGFLILNELITRRQVEGTLIAFFGTMIIIFAPLLNGNFVPQQAKTAFIGNIIFFLGILADGLYSIYTKKNLSRDKIVTPFIQTMVGFVIAAIVFTPLGFYEQVSMYRNRHVEPVKAYCTINDFDRAANNAGLRCDVKGCYETNSKSPLEAKALTYKCFIKEAQPTFSSFIKNNLRTYTMPPALYGIAYMAIISGIIAYISYQFGLQRVEASEASVFYYLQPLFAIPIAVIFLKEPLSLVFLVGAMIVAAGVYLAEKRE